MWLSRVAHVAGFVAGCVRFGALPRSDNRGSYGAFCAERTPPRKGQLGAISQDESRSCGRDSEKPVLPAPAYTSPWSSMALATLRKPAMFAPFT